MPLKKLKLNGTSLPTLAALAGPAHATLFKYTGADVFYSVPTTGTYQIAAEGAQGGGTAFGTGGLGAYVLHDFRLVKGDRLTIAVGGEGGASSAEGLGSWGSGGGGGNLAIMAGSIVGPLVLGAAAAFFSYPGGFVTIALFTMAAPWLPRFL